MRTRMRYSTAVLLLVLTTGCSSVDVPEQLDVLAWEDRVETPDQAVGYWNEQIKHQQGDSPKRGFGGKVMFYKNGNRKAVRVDGTVVIYAYDEDNRRPGDARPDRAFVFRADQLEQFRTETELGHAYNLWLEWGEAEGPRKDISLIIRFQPARGPMVVAQMTRHVLTGSDAFDEPLTVSRDVQPAVAPQEQESEAERVRRASYDDAARRDAQVLTPRTDVVSGGDPSPRQMRTTTIHLPSRFGSERTRMTER